MPTNYSIAVLNSIRAEASQDYQYRIPEATQTNLAEIGRAFEAYTPLYNEFAAALMNKIGKTIIETKMWKNKLAKFKNGGVTSPHDVEEIFIEMAEAEGAYDPEGKNPNGRRDNPETKVIYHRQNRQECYAVSVGDIDFRRVFTSGATLDTYMKGLINSVYAGDQLDEWLCMKELLATYGKYAEYEVPDINYSSMGSIDNTVLQNTKSFIKALRKAVLDVGFPSTKYNAAGVRTFTEPKDLVLLVHKDVLVECDVELLAQAFNQSNTDMKVVPEIVAMDDFGTLEKCYGLLVDREWFRVWDTLSHMEPQRNAQGLFTNWFYHHHQILSASTFKNAIMFKAVANDTSMTAE